MFNTFKLLKIKKVKLTRNFQNKHRREKVLHLHQSIATAHNMVKQNIYIINGPTFI